VGVAHSKKRINPFAGARIDTFKALCQAYAPEALALIKDMIEDRSTREAIRFQALKFVVEQAYGKASQSLVIREEQEVSAAMMSTAQLRLAAAGQTQELVCSLIESGKLDEYTRAYKGLREEKDITQPIEALKDKREAEARDGLKDGRVSKIKAKRASKK
jgi:hypothetical protein